MPTSKYLFASIPSNDAHYLFIARIEQEYAQPILRYASLKFKEKPITMVSLPLLHTWGCMNAFTDLPIRLRWAFCAPFVVIRVR